jgi:hypothetical protein
MHIYNLRPKNHTRPSLNLEVTSPPCPPSEFEAGFQPRNPLCINIYQEDEIITTTARLILDIIGAYLGPGDSSNVLRGGSGPGLLINVSMRC